MERLQRRRPVCPKIADLLGQPGAELARRLLRTARAHQAPPTLFLGLRVTTSTFVYDDPDHPDRPTATITSPDWTPEDRALVLGLEAYEASLCRCGWPRRIAWHADMDGWFDPEEYVCHACSGAEGKEVVHAMPPTTARDFETRPLSDFDWKTTTTPPTEANDDD